MAWHLLYSVLCLLANVAKKYGFAKLFLASLYIVFWLRFVSYLCFLLLKSAWDCCVKMKAEWLECFQTLVPLWHRRQMWKHYAHLLCYNIQPIFTVLLFTTKQWCVSSFQNDNIWQWVPFRFRHIFPFVMITFSSLIQREIILFVLIRLYLNNHCLSFA